MKSVHDKHKIWRVKSVQSSVVQICKRWAVVYRHDGSPVDGAVFMHRNKAEVFLLAQKRPDAYRIEQIAIMSSDMAEHLLFGDVRKVA